jgi:hypothetical protein
MPSLYATFAALLGQRQLRKLAGNTYLERIDAKTIGVRYHATHVLTATPSYVELDSGGWHTKTTWERMSEGGIDVRGGRAVVVYLAGESRDTGGHPYFDGIRLSADGSRLAAKQPNMPEGIMAPVRTVSGWSGSTRARRLHEPFYKPLGGSHDA